MNPNDSKPTHPSADAALVDPLTGGSASPATQDPQLQTLLGAVDAQAPLAQRHLWLIHMLAWLRGDGRSVHDVLRRLPALAQALESHPSWRASVAAWWTVLHQEVDARTLLAEHGFTQHAAFLSALADRVRRKLLPATPETNDPIELFMLAFDEPFDAQWLAAIEAPLAQRLLGLLQPAPQAASDWRAPYLDAITFCISQVRAAGFSSEVRTRMPGPGTAAHAFHALDADFIAVRAALDIWPAQAHQRADAVSTFRTSLEACRAAASSVYASLADQGISMSLVFRLRELRERLLRIRELLDIVLGDNPAAASTRLLARLVQVSAQQTSVRSLIRRNSSLLAAKMAERHAETGEHYITRNRAEYRDMLARAAGGGAFMSLTTAAKFAIAALGLGAFWTGFFSGLNYALSFMAIQLLHWTVATKQPAMTAPTLAARLKEAHDDAGLERFVDEVTHLVRSQVAAVLGNLALVVPGVLILSGACLLLWGRPMINTDSAEHVLHALTVLGPTALYAAFTGVLLFASSMVAGWAENWFVLHRLDSAIRYNPRVSRMLGPARATRWAGFMRENISGFAANVSLGLMLGLVPAFALFFGLALEVRHVTLSTGQVAAAIGSLGWQAFALPALWWCLVGVLLTGALNVGVSFYLAFRLALAANGVTNVDRQRIRAAIWQRWRQEPASFFRPQPEVPSASG